MPETDDLLTAGQAADVLQVEIGTVRRWANAGKLPFWRTPGGQRRFRRSDLESLMRPEPAPEPTEAAGMSAQRKDAETDRQADVTQAASSYPTEPVLLTGPGEGRS